MAHPDHPAMASITNQEGSDEGFSLQPASENPAIGGLIGTIYHLRWPM